ncbi:MAG: hypothetical protein LBR97_01160 [Dysgonamonadaceae bacterium]|jgi:hypothetical protein|nr:hypothetical protein [Dysgonamonadaceae bacterium]
MDIQAQPVQQYSEITFPRYAVSLEPFYLYNGSLRLNVEKRLESNDWIELNITGYYLPHDEIETRKYKGGSYFTSNSDFERFSGLSGLGIGSAYKHYISRYFFMSAGASYTCYHVRYADISFSKFQEDGLEFYEYKYQDFRQIFNKFTANLSIGARSTFRRTLFIEYYLGVGYAHSLYNKDKKAYDSYAFGFGYKGIYPTSGFKIGFNIR